MPEFTASRSIESDQDGLHEDLEIVVAKRLANFSQRPNVRQRIPNYAEILRLINEADSWICDAGCGTGESTYRLAESHPNSLVIGVDKSRKRLARGVARDAQERISTSNVILLDAMLEDWWLAVAQDAPAPKHLYILYPNPWPKSTQLTRRWHGSEVFGTIVAMACPITLRTNWEIYAREFNAAMTLAGRTSSVNSISVNFSDALTNFESKYARSGQKLWEVTVS